MTNIQPVPGTPARATFTTPLALAEITPGKYEIHTMTAGTGNGWTIPDTC